MLAQKHSKEYKMYEDTTGNKCLLSSLPKTPKCRGPELLRFWVHARGRERRAHHLEERDRKLIKLDFSDFLIHQIICGSRGNADLDSKALE